MILFRNLWLETPTTIFNAFAFGPLPSVTRLKWLRELSDPRSSVAEVENELEDEEASVAGIEDASRGSLTSVE